MIHDDRTYSGEEVHDLLLQAADWAEGALLGLERLYRNDLARLRAELDQLTAEIAEMKGS